VIALVLPREHHKVEHTNPLSSLSDEELAAMVEHLKERIARRVAGSQVKLIKGQAVLRCQRPSMPSSPDDRTSSWTQRTPRLARWRASRRTARCRYRRACDLRSVVPRQLARAAPHGPYGKLYVRRHWKA
jgi:hypothetical protein